MGQLHSNSTSSHSGPQPKPRVPFPQRVWLRTGRQNSAVETYASNVSESGIFVQTTNPPEVGSRVLIQFQIQGNDQTVEAVAEVVWIKPFEPINIDGILPGLGAKFVAIEPNAQDALRSYISKQLAQHQAQQQAASAQAAEGVEKTQQLALEKQMLLQVKGDSAPVLGYVSTITEEHMEFEPEQVPANSLLGRWQRQRSAGQLKGCIALPVEIENQDASRPGGTLRLHFLEPRADLLKLLPELTRRLLPEEVTSPHHVAEAPDKTTPHRASIWWSRLIFCAAVALSALAGTLVGAWLLQR